MGNPKSFKDLFQNKKKVPMNGGNLIVTPKGNQPNPDFELQQVRKQKELIAYVNTKRCTVCGSQLDGPVYAKEARLYCVENQQHYICKYVYNDFKLVNCKAEYVFHVFGYEVISNLLDTNQYRNSISKLDMNLIERYRYRDKVLLLSFEGALLRFPKDLTEEEFVQKLKLYTVFS